MNQVAHGVLTFLTYALDPANAQLRRGDTIIPLRPKTLSVLQYMAERSGRLVTKSELLDAIWPDTAVTESTLTSSIKELRRVLDDDPKRPHVIETAHGHGYRFIAEVHQELLGGDGNEHAEAVRRLAATRSGADTSLLSTDRRPANRLPLVGRDGDLAQLDAWLAGALARERQVAFIAGDAGLGKTALVDAFCAQLRHRGVLVAHGQCLEHHGASEPYLPVLEGLERLCGTAEGAPLLALLRRHAPTWLAQLVGLLEPDEIESLQRHLAGTTRERMLREMASLVVALPIPLVLVLEDLHWSDNATIDLVAALAQRRDAAPLLVIGTYRPVDVVIDEHPFRLVHQQLRAHGRIRELWLNPLDEQAVSEYVRARWPGLASARGLARVVYDRTDGNPLFVVSVADYLVTDGTITEVDGQCRLNTDVGAVRVGVPQGLRPMIAAQIDRLEEMERSVLEAGSIVGRTFSAALVAAAVATDVVDVETRLARLARRGQLVRGAGEAAWPDGTVAGRYELIHSLHQHELAERVPPARRRQLHERIASRLESGYGARTSDIAPELAYHFEAGPHPERAVPYIEEVAARAGRRCASQEARAALERALAVLDALPPTPERNVSKVRAYLALPLVIGPFGGGASAEIEQFLLRARSLSEETDDVSGLFQALAGLTGLYITGARFEEAKESTTQVAALAERIPFPAFIGAGMMFSGMIAFHTGDLIAARDYLDRVGGLIDLVQPGNPITLYIYTLSYRALALLHLGLPDAALNCNREGMEHAARVGTPFDRGQAAMIGCHLRIFVRDVDGLERAADEAAALAEDYGFAMVAAVAKLAHGRVRVARGEHAGGLAMMQEAIDDYREGRQAIGLPTIIAAFADANAEAGRIDEALVLVAQARALIESTGEVRFSAELARLDGELRERRGELDVAERGYRRAIEISRNQGAPWWELRASVSLAQLQQQQRKRAVARRTLEPVISSFTEGFETADLRAAKSLLAALA